MFNILYQANVSFNRMCRSVSNWDWMFETYRITFGSSFWNCLQQQQPPECSQQSSQPHIIAARPQTEEAPRSCPQASDPTPFPAAVASGSSVSQPQAVVQVPAHMHLLCDVVPCPVRSSLASIHRHLSEGIDGSQTKDVSEKTQKPPEHSPPLPPASSGAMGRAELIHQSRSEGGKKEEDETRVSETKKEPSLRKKKKSTR